MSGKGVGGNRVGANLLEPCSHAGFQKRPFMQRRMNRSRSARTASRHRHPSRRNFGVGKSPNQFIPHDGEARMTDIKKDHSIGEGTGAGTGAITGAAIGSAGGPVGAAVGAVVGAVVGAKAGGAIAEAVNPTEYTEHFRRNFESASYRDASRGWDDYEPAYRYGYDRYEQYGGRKFDDIESNLERDWDATRGKSQLAWSEARGAVRDGWHYIERAMPGDADRDGR
jgi:hypothetical protein